MIKATTNSIQIPLQKFLHFSFLNLLFLSKATSKEDEDVRMEVQVRGNCFSYQAIYEFQF